MAICGVATWVSVISLARRPGGMVLSRLAWVWVLGSGFEFEHGSPSRLFPLCVAPRACSARCTPSSGAFWLSARCP